MSNQQRNVCDPIYSELAQSDADFADIVELFVSGLVDRLRSMEEALNGGPSRRVRARVSCCNTMQVPPLGAP